MSMLAAAAPLTAQEIVTGPPGSGTVAGVTVNESIVILLMKLCTMRLL